MNSSCSRRSDPKDPFDLFAENETVDEFCDICQSLAPQVAARNQLMSALRSFIKENEPSPRLPTLPLATSPRRQVLSSLNKSPSKAQKRTPVVSPLKKKVSPSERSKENENQENIASPFRSGSRTGSKKEITKILKDAPAERVELPINIDFGLKTPERGSSLGEVMETVVTVPKEIETVLPLPLVMVECVPTPEECQPVELIIEPTTAPTPIIEPATELTIASTTEPVIEPTKDPIETISPPENQSSESGGGGFYDVLEDGIMNGRIEIQVSGRKVTSTHVEYFLRLQILAPDDELGDSTSSPSGQYLMQMMAIRRYSQFESFYQTLRQNPFVSSALSSSSFPFPRKQLIPLWRYIARFTSSCSIRLTPSLP
jgi:hypothetical protein